MTNAERIDYNKQCSGAWRIFDASASWGITLHNPRTLAFREVYYNEFHDDDKQFWSKVDGMCGYQRGCEANAS